MTYHDKTIKIAEACGWLDVKVEPLDAEHPNDRHDWPHGVKELGSFIRQPVPDYFGCLNACREMEKVLSDQEYDEFTELLEYITYSDGQTSIQQARKVIGASSAHRAEAFGQTLKLWEAGE